MRIRIALATAVAVIFIPVVLLLTVFSGAPSGANSGSRHEAAERLRASHTAKPMSNSQSLRTAQLTSLYQAINSQQDAAWLNAVHNNQLAAFAQAVNAQQDQQKAAWLNAVHNNQLAAFAQAVNAAKQQPPAAPAAPAPAPSAPAPPAPASATSGGGWTGPWACIAQHESGGNPAANTGNGFYGGLQFTQQTWSAYGGSGSPANASIAQQEAVAQRVQAAQGWGAWPNTSRMCGL